MKHKLYTCSCSTLPDEVTKMQKHLVEKALEFANRLRYETAARTVDMATSSRPFSKGPRETAHKQVYPAGYHRVQFAFRDSMIHVICNSH